VSWTERATLVRAFFRCERRRRICNGVVVPAASIVLLSKESLGCCFSGMPTTSTWRLFLTAVNLSVRTISERPIRLAQTYRSGLAFGGYPFLFAAEIETNLTGVLWFSSCVRLLLLPSNFFPIYLLVFKPSRTDSTAESTTHMYPNQGRSKRWASRTAAPDANL
jgi:hypothetical protein